MKRDQTVIFESRAFLSFFLFLILYFVVEFSSAFFLSLFIRFLSLFFGTSMQAFLFIEINPWKWQWEQLSVRKSIIQMKVAFSKNGCAKLTGSSKKTNLTGVNAVF